MKSMQSKGFARLTCLLLTVCVAAGFVGVASAAPENEVPLTWTPPTTRETGVALPASEIGGYQIFLDGKAIAQPAGNANSYTYVIPTDVCITPANKWYAIAKDTAGQISKPSTTVSSVGTRCGPKSPPSAPGNVAVGF